MYNNNGNQKTKTKTKAVYNVVENGEYTNWNKVGYVGSDISDFMGGCWI